MPSGSPIWHSVTTLTLLVTGTSANRHFGHHVDSEKVMDVVFLIDKNTPKIRIHETVLSAHAHHTLDTSCPIHNKALPHQE
ncbi:hypothetical protein PTT_01505 [Pyrenophora teres f. teres 0-1]|uniref:Secreted protein n=1 Tax=Pyrenophora teres f. teres (strain 0-1) TaxID=861557 RepID=E3RD25_PYRTT|nr:hypothetical protein PTT_01505 [Pyrenophora teres f. teres 0-1]